MTQGEATPTPPQVKRQIAEMLEHPIFVSRVQPARVLKFVAETALEDGDVSEEAILQAVFTSQKKYEAGSTIVRTTVDTLRKSLTEYYDERDDLVIITLPKSPPGRKIGDSYRPRFEYNPHRQITKDYYLASSLVRRAAFIDEYLRAIAMLEVIIEQEPGHAGAMACLADALLATFIIYDVPNEMHEGLFDMVDDLTKAALELAPKFWRAHSARALFHGCRSEYDLAQKHFHRAMELDRSNTESQTLYTLFLVKHQHASEALRLTGHLAEEQFDDALSQCIYGFHLFRAERFEDAERVFQIALGLDRNLWLAHAGAAYVYSKLGRLEEARKHAKRLEVLLDDPVHYQHWMSGLALPPEQ